MSKINLKALIINFENNKGQNCVAYISQPTEEEMQAIALPLGQLFSKWKNSNLDTLVVVKDWKILLDNEIKDKSYLKALKAFFERRIDISTIFNKDTGEKLKLSDLVDSDYEVIQGSLLFYLSVLRYATALFENEKLKAIITSLSALDFQNSLKK